MASYQFTLEYQKGADNGTADALSQVPICHNQETIKFLLEGAVTGATDHGQVEASEALLSEHECGRLVRGPRGRSYVCHVLQVDVHQERHPSSQKGCTLE